MDPKPCPFCGASDPHVMRDPELSWIECKEPECDARGPQRDTEAEAIVAWNLAIRAPTSILAFCQHLTWCGYCNPALEARR